MVIILLVISFITILFIPFKITLYISRHDYFIKLNRLILLSKEGGILKKFISKSKVKKVKKKSKNVASKNKSFIKVSIKLLYNSLKNNRYKPKLKISINFNYSLADAYKTAIFYGLSSNLELVLYNLFSIIFKFTQFNFNLEPEFKDNMLLEFTISSIISFNLAQIIYMLFLILKSRKKNEEVTP